MPDPGRQEKKLLFFSMRQKMTGTQGTPTGLLLVVGRDNPLRFSSSWTCQECKVLLLFIQAPISQGFAAESDYDSETTSPFQDKKQARLWFAVRLADSLNSLFISQLHHKPTVCVISIQAPPRHPHSTSGAKGTGAYTLTWGMLCSD